MKKYILALCICAPVLYAKKSETAEQQIRVSSVAHFFKKRIERISRHTNRLPDDQCQVIQEARKWYRELREHHGTVRNKKRTATMPESVYRQINQALALLEKSAKLRTPQEPEKKYVIPHPKGQFKNVLSFTGSSVNEYWQKALEFSGVGIVLLLIYKTFIRPNSPEVVVVNGESNEPNEELPALAEGALTSGETV